MEPIVFILTVSPFVTIIVATIFYYYQIISLYNLTVINDSLWFLFDIAYLFVGVIPLLEPNNPEINSIGQSLLTLTFLIVLTIYIRIVILACLIINMCCLLLVLNTIGYSYTLNYIYTAITIGGVLLQLLLMDIEMEKNERMQQEYELAVIKIIHDLKNPILSIIQVLKDENDIEVIKNDVSTEAHECLDMLTDLNISFKVRKGMEVNEEPQLVDLSKFVKNLCKAHANLSENCKNKLDFVDVNNNNQYMISKKLVKRIMHNFITNSLKHTRNGQVTVSYNWYNLKLEPQLVGYLKNQISFKELHQVGGILDEDKEYIKFEVKDTGEGMKPIVMEIIFDEMLTDQKGANWEGSGLGLSICKTLCTKIGASIIFSSEYGVGSSFSLWVPVHKACKENDFIDNIDTVITTDNTDNLMRTIDNSYLESKVTTDFMPKTYSSDTNNQKNKKIESKNEININICKHIHNHKDEYCMNESGFCPDLSNVKVVIAEDSRVLGKTYRKYFDKEEIPYVFCTDGLECLEYIMSNKNNLSHFLLFTDNQMPHLSGVELARELRKFNLNCYIILVSADDIVDNESIFNKVYTKPFPLKTFKEEYKHFIRSFSIDHKIPDEDYNVQN